MRAKDSKDALKFKVNRLFLCFIVLIIFSRQSLEQKKTLLNTTAFLSIIYF